jgi:DNA-binding GntR family transcriptional regulator
LRNQTNLVHQELKQRIIDGLFGPAESLTELSLAAQLRVSRSTIRKALLKLESENLVIIEENRRARVRRFSLEEAIQYLEVRELLEGFVIRQSVPFIGKNELKEMHDNLLQMRTCLDEKEFVQYPECHWHFHDVIYRLCPNRPAADMIKGIKNQLRQFNIRAVLIPGRGEKSFEEHNAIFSAIRRKEAGEAARLMQRHIANFRMVLQKNYQLLL